MTVPLLPFLRLDRWGLHYHGKVQNSLLTLPNAATMAWPQPSNSDVRLVKFDGFSVPTTTPIQNLKGQQFLNYGLITAGKVAQTTIDGQFIYRDTGGKVWLIKIEVSSWTDATVNLNITYSRFGLINAEGSEFEQHVKPLSIDTGLPTPSSYGVSFENASPTGKKCCLKVTASGGVAAYLEITLNNLVPSGVTAKAMSETVVYTRVDTTTSSGLRFWSITGGGSTGYEIACPVSAGLPHNATITGTAALVPKGGDDVISEITLERITGAVYDKAGDLKFFSLRSKSIYNQTKVDISTGSSGLVRSEISWESVSGTNPWCSVFAWSFRIPVRTAEVTGVMFGDEDFDTRKLEVDLLLDGSVQSSLTAEYTTSQWATATGDMSAGDGPVDPTLTAPDITGGGMINRVNAAGVYPVIDTPIDSTINPGTMQSYLASIHNLHVAAYDAYVANGDVTTGLDVNVLKDSANTNYHILDTKISNNARYLVYGHDLVNNEASTGLADVRFCEVVHPEGSDGSFVRGDRAIRSGAFHPETEEVVRNQANTVSFV